MGKRNRFHDAIDPDLRRWEQTYPRFPGVEECAQLIRAGKARGSWAEIIAGELAENADNHLTEMIAAFREGDGDHVSLYMMMALEIAATPASIDFLSQVLLERNEQFALYARRALQTINTRESRKALFDASHAEIG